MRATFNQRVELLLRLETFAQSLIMEHTTFSAMPTLSSPRRGRARGRARRPEEHHRLPHRLDVA